MATQDDREKQHRRSIRLKGYDYSRSGMYFVTICTRNRECLFGALTDDEVRLNDSGRLASAAWEELPSRFPTVSLDSFVVMPNHIHGIIIVGAQFIAPASSQFIAPPGSMQFIVPASAPHNQPSIAQTGRDESRPYVRRNRPYL